MCVCVCLCVCNSVWGGGGHCSAIANLAIGANSSTIHSFHPGNVGRGDQMIDRRETLL